MLLLQIMKVNYFPWPMLAKKFWRARKVFNDRTRVPNNSMEFTKVCCVLEQKRIHLAD